LESGLCCGECGERERERDAGDDDDDELGVFRRRPNSEGTQEEEEEEEEEEQERVCFTKEKSSSRRGATRDVWRCPKEVRNSETLLQRLVVCAFCLSAIARVFFAMCIFFFFCFKTTSGGKKKVCIRQNRNTHSLSLSLFLVSSIYLVFFALRRWGVQVLQL
jgi:hypothetical protein